MAMVPRQGSISDFTEVEDLSKSVLNINLLNNLDTLYPERRDKSGKLLQGFL